MKNLSCVLACSCIPTSQLATGSLLRGWTCNKLWDSWKDGYLPLLWIYRLDRQSCSCYVTGDDIYTACHIYRTKSNICLLKYLVSAVSFNLTNTTWWGRNMCEEITVHQEILASWHNRQFSSKLCFMTMTTRSAYII